MKLDKWYYIRYGFALKPSKCVQIVGDTAILKVYTDNGLFLETTRVLINEIVGEVRDCDIPKESFWNWLFS